MKRIERQRSEIFGLNDGRQVELDCWSLTSNREPPRTSDPAPTGMVSEVMAWYRSVPTKLNDLYPRLGCILPYAEYGSLDPENSILTRFQRSEVIRTTHAGAEPHFMRTSWSLDLELYARIRQGIDPKRDESLTYLCRFATDASGMHATVATGKWSGGRCSMDSAGLRIEVRDGDQGQFLALTRELVRRYGSGTTIREAVRSELGDGLPPFESGAYQYNLGVGGTILTRDNKLVITRRGRGVHINIGRVYSAGGGVLQAKDANPKTGLQEMLERAMLRELVEEIGDTNYLVEPVGFVRELPREGSPEFFYLVRFGGTVEDLLEVMAENPHPDCSEVDGYVYGINPEDLPALLENADGTQVVQHKGMVILFYIAKHLGLF